jgi:hypothetical protein
MLCRHEVMLCRNDVMLCSNDVILCWNHSKKEQAVQLTSSPAA